MGFADIRVKHHPHKRSTLSRRAANPTCATGGFYISPSNGATVDSMKPLPITWDPTCLTTTTADIYLFSPDSSRARIHVWQGVPFASGSYNATLMPRWWNSTSSQSLQLAIVAAGDPPFLTTLPAGPVITATYSAPASGKPVPAAADTSKTDSGITQVNAPPSNTNKSISPGSTAAAVLLPLLFIGFCIAAYFHYQRRKQQKETEHFSQNLDKRMSTISADWKSISAAGANAAIRSSIASGARNSTAFSFGNIRPSSTAGSISIVPGQAGVGSYYNHDGDQMTQVRTGTGIGLRHPAANGSTERVSRISFAADTRFSRASTYADSRPSGESSRKGVPTRAFHSGYIPPVPAVRPEIVSVYNEKVQEKVREKDAELSPRQAAGPLMLMPEDIRARMQGDNGPEDANGIDEVMPALSLMRTGSLNGGQSSTEEEGDDYLLSIPEPAHTHSHAHSNSDSPIAMSPDEMLRQYAAKRAASATPPPSSPGGAKIKGRKLSLRNGFGIGLGRKGKSEKGIEGGLSGSPVGVGPKGLVISYPVPAATANSPVSPMSGAQGLGHYAISEEEDYEDAYGGVH